MSKGWTLEDVSKKSPDLQRQVQQLLYGKSTVAPHRDLSPSPKPQPAFRDAPLQAPEGKEPYSGKVRIRVASVRKRLIDPDNLCPKYFIDCCRYAGLIRDDSADCCEILTTQRKPREAEDEHTEIVIEPIP